MPTYRPEGLQNQPIPTPEVLRRAGGSREIFQAMCIKCDEFHNLVVDLGCLRGLIPREETALGIADGSAREIAILSRVGKPVCFQVLGFTSDGTVLLTRRGAQAEALDYFFTHLQPGDILPAVVQNPASFGTFCDIGCGVTALMSIERCSVSRITHCNQRFSPGQKIYVSILSLDREAQRINLTHRELLGTWAENAAAFTVGETVVGIVRSVEEYGTFIEIAPNLAGLAESCPDLRPGQAVSVYIKNILPEKMKIKLVIVNHALSQSHRFELRYFITEGHLDHWLYSTPESHKRIETDFSVMACNPA